MRRNSRSRKRGSIGRSRQPNSSARCVHSIRFRLRRALLGGSTVRIWRAHAGGSSPANPADVGVVKSADASGVRVTCGSGELADNRAAACQRQAGRGARICQRIADQGRRSLRQPSYARARVSTVESPALADVLRHAAAAWQSFRSGRSLDRALAAALAEHPELRPAVQDALYTAVRHLAASRAHSSSVWRLVLRRPTWRRCWRYRLLNCSANRMRRIPLSTRRCALRNCWGTTSAASGFVNAVLRNFLRQRAALLAELQSDASVRYNLPAWWIERLRSEYPNDWTSIAESQQQMPPLVLRVNAMQVTADDYLARLAQLGTRSDPGRRARHLVASTAAGDRHSGLPRRRRVGPGRRRATGRSMARRQAGHARARCLCCAWRKDCASGRTGRHRLDRGRSRCRTRRAHCRKSSVADT